MQGFRLQLRALAPHRCHMVRRHQDKRPSFILLLTFALILFGFLSVQYIDTVRAPATSSAMGCVRSAIHAHAPPAVGGGKTLALHGLNRLMAAASSSTTSLGLGFAELSLAAPCVAASGERHAIGAHAERSHVTGRAWGSVQDIVPEKNEFKYVRHHHLHAEYHPPTAHTGGALASNHAMTPRPSAHPPVGRTSNPPPRAHAVVPHAAHLLLPRAAPHVAQAITRRWTPHAARAREMPPLPPAPLEDKQGDDDEPRQSISKPVDEPVAHMYEQAVAEAAHTKRTEEERALNAAEVPLNLPPVSTKRFSGRFVLSQCVPDATVKTNPLRVLPLKRRDTGAPFHRHHERGPSAARGSMADS